ncbi:M56 family metallopeptidase [Paenibacillus senegalensis]|uniref:M56 family metallopeptidase n=1 Tax=Paenibacillus senegalensis TaxID=1465766 RepID=UPI0002887A5F|nr:M56 family metallopeptidase [Paenibacillus senegalensis]
MNKLLESLVSLTAAGSIVMICILLLRVLSPNGFPATWRYALGKMAIVFYLLPVALALQGLASLLNPRTATSAMNLQESAAVTQTLPFPGHMPEMVVTGPTISGSIVLPFISLWGIGAAAFALWQTFCFFRFMRNIQHTRTSVPKHSEAAEQLALMKKTLGIQSNVQLAYSSAIRSPILVGLWKPTIFLPVKNSNMDISLVLHHELIHLKRKDLWVKAAVMAASALHWFNPLVHLLRKEIHMWSELSCDEQVVKDMSHTERKRYGETILNVMIGSKDVPVRFCASLSGDGLQLKRRLTMMLNVRKLKTRTIVLTTAALIAVGAIGTSTAVWASNHTPQVEHAIVYKDAGDSLVYNGVRYLKFSALSPEDQTFVIEETFKGQLYAIEGYDHPLPADELTPEEQQQVSLEEGYYSPASIARIKEFREKFPRGETVTHTHESDPSIPPGMSVTIRDLTPEEIAEFEQRRIENEKLRQSLLNLSEKSELGEKQAEK